MARGEVLAKSISQLAESRLAKGLEISPLIRSFAVDYRKPLIADAQENSPCLSSLVLNLSFWQA
jgi:hypothetical protein